MGGLFGKPDTSAQQRQIEEQRKQLEEQKKREQERAAREGAAAQAAARARAGGSGRRTLISSREDSELGIGSDLPS